MTFTGTRPCIIRLSRIIPKLDERCNHILVNSMQNHLSSLNEVFFYDLGLRTPNETLNIVSNNFAEQIGKLYTQGYQALIKYKPDKVLVLGDTNTALISVVAERLGIPVVHMEAGNRCYDLEVPEEINRKIIDHISTYNLPYTKNSAHNLRNEGIVHNVHVFGNPIKEVLDYFEPQIEKSNMLNTLGLTKQKYILSTFHRAECVDNLERLKIIIESLHEVARMLKMPIIISTHPRTQFQIEKNKISSICFHNHLRFMEPMRFFDFVKLEKNAYMCITDSGTVQEEACLFHVPTVTCRRTSERPETVWCGSNIVSGISKEGILNAVNTMKDEHTWEPPKEYLVPDVSEKVVNFILGE